MVLGSAGLTRKIFWLHTTTFGFGVCGSDEKNILTTHDDIWFWGLRVWREKYFDYTRRHLVLGSAGLTRKIFWLHTTTFGFGVCGSDEKNILTTHDDICFWGLRVWREKYFDYTRRHLVLGSAGLTRKIFWLHTTTFVFGVCGSDEKNILTTHDDIWFWGLRVWREKYFDYTRRHLFLGSAGLTRKILWLHTTTFVFGVCGSDEKNILTTHDDIWFWGLRVWREKCFDNTRRHLFLGSAGLTRKIFWLHTTTFAFGVCGSDEKNILTTHDDIWFGICGSDEKNILTTHDDICFWGLRVWREKYFDYTRRHLVLGSPGLTKAKKIFWLHTTTFGFGVSGSDDAMTLYSGIKKLTTHDDIYTFLDKKIATRAKHWPWILCRDKEGCPGL